MNPYVQHILVPTDLSEFATLAIRYAKMLGEVLDAKLTLLHAAPSTGMAALMDNPLGYYFENRPDEVIDLQGVLAEQARENGLLVERGDLVVVQDYPGPAIVDLAQNRDVDLIVMGTHGRSGWRRAVLGSVAEQVLHQAPCPVLTVTPNRMRQSGASIGRIVCPVDFSETARAGLDVAASLAEALDAELIVMYVAEEPSPSALYVEEIFGDWVPANIRRNSGYRQIVARGDVAQEILRAAGSLKCDLIVMGAERRALRDKTVFGANARSILRNAEYPVLTVTGISPRRIRFARRLETWV